MIAVIDCDYFFFYCLADDAEQFQVIISLSGPLCLYVLYVEMF